MCIWGMTFGLKGLELKVSSIIVQTGFQWNIFGSKLNKLGSKQLLTIYLLTCGRELSGHIHHGLQPKSADK